MGTFMDIMDAHLNDDFIVEQDAISSALQVTNLKLGSQSRLEHRNIIVLVKVRLDYQH